MDRIGDEVVLARAEITDAAAATFADSTVIPDRYARPDEMRDGVVVGDQESYELPLVDMARLLDSESSEAETAKLGSACRHWGFFQVSHPLYFFRMEGICIRIIHFCIKSTRSWFAANKPRS